MITKAEKKLLIEIITNVDDIKRILDVKQAFKVRRCFNKIYANYLDLIEGISDD